MTNCSVVKDKMVCQYLKDVVSFVTVHGLEGDFLYNIDICLAWAKLMALQVIGIGLKPSTHIQTIPIPQKSLNSMSTLKKMNYLKHPN